MDFLLLQLADSAFPTGGFAHSGGLEASVAAGQVRSEPELRAYLRDALVQTANGACPFVLAGHDARGSPDDLREVDARCDHFLVGEIANRASRTQGRALLDTAARIFPHPELALLREKLSGSARHQAPIFGAVSRVLGLASSSSPSSALAASLFAYVTLRSFASAAVRLGVVGPHRAQRLIFDLAPTLATLRVPPMSEAAWTSPLHDLFLGTHDRLYARLFQS